MPSTHVYLVSEQATPNITPALDAETRPDKVVLVVSEAMKQRAAWLTSVLREAAGVQVDTWEIASPWEIEPIRNRILALLEKYGDADIALNATGGTKPMSIAAHDIFRDLDLPIFYIHPQKDQLVWLQPWERQGKFLADKVKLSHFLRAYGSTVLEKGGNSVLPAYTEVGKELILNFKSFNKALGSFNFYAMKASNHQLSTTVDSPTLNNGAFLDVLSLFENADLLTLNENRITFTSDEARFFVNGGWLEQYVFRTVQSLKKSIPEIQDVAQSVEISREGRDGKVIKNELDVALLCNNRLHIIECKTKKFAKHDDTADGPGAEAVYKLDTLKELLGGLRGGGMLVSYLEVGEYDKRRAEDLGIKVVDGPQLQNLKGRLSEWVKPR